MNELAGQKETREGQKVVILDNGVVGFFMHITKDNHHAIDIVHGHGNRFAWDQIVIRHCGRIAERDNVSEWYVVVDRACAHGRAWSELLLTIVSPFHNRLSFRQIRLPFLHVFHDGRLLLSSICTNTTPTFKQQRRRSVVLVTRLPTSLFVDSKVVNGGMLIFSSQQNLESFIVAVVVVAVVVVLDVVW